MTGFSLKIPSITIGEVFWMHVNAARRNFPAIILSKRILFTPKIPTITTER